MSLLSFEDARTQLLAQARPVVGTELVSSSITSGGDGSEKQNGSDAVLADNPHEAPLHQLFENFGALHSPQSFDVGPCDGLAIRDDRQRL